MVVVMERNTFCLSGVCVCACFVRVHMCVRACVLCMCVRARVCVRARACVLFSSCSLPSFRGGGVCIGPYSSECAACSHSNVTEEKRGGKTFFEEDERKEKTTTKKPVVCGWWGWVVGWLSQ